LATAEVKLDETLATSTAGILVTLVSVQ